MPKQIADLSKFERVGLVLKIVTRQGRATPQMVVEKLAASLPAEINIENLRRSVYRDLKDLATTGKLVAEYFSSDGTRIDGEPDDSDKKNFRVEYSMPASKSAIIGFENLDAHGADLLFRDSQKSSWRISDSMPEAGAKVTGVIAEAGVSEFLGVFAAHDSLPFKIIIARNQDDEEPSPGLVEELSKKFGDRLAVLLLKDRHLSRATGVERSGHAVFEFEKEAGVFSIEDLGSTGGTYCTPLTPELQKFVSKRMVAQRAVSTFIPGDASVLTSVNWEKIESKKTYRHPVLVKLAKILVAVL